MKFPRLPAPIEAAKILRRRAALPVAGRPPALRAAGGGGQRPEAAEPGAGGAGGADGRLRWPPLGAGPPYSFLLSPLSFFCFLVGSYCFAPPPLFSILFREKRCASDTRGFTRGACKLLRSSRFFRHAGRGLMLGLNF